MYLLISLIQNVIHKNAGHRTNSPRVVPIVIIKFCTMIFITSIIITQINTQKNGIKLKITDVNKKIGRKAKHKKISHQSISS